MIITTKNGDMVDTIQIIEDNVYKIEDVKYTVETDMYIRHCTDKNMRHREEAAGSIRPGSWKRSSVPSSTVHQVHETVGEVLLMAEPVIISAAKQGGVENAYVGTIVRMGL